MTGRIRLSRSGSEASPIIPSDRMRRPMPIRMRPSWRRSRRDVAMNSTVPATRQSGTSASRSKLSSLTTSAEPISAPSTASRPAMPADDAGTGEGADDQRDRPWRSAGDGQRGAGGDRQQRVPQDGPQLVAQHVAIGALDAGAHLRVANSSSATAPARCSRTSEPLMRGASRRGRLGSMPKRVLVLAPPSVTNPARLPVHLAG